jgi:chaperone modulatory protein CbpM
MTAQRDEAVWPEMADTVGFADMALACAISPNDLQELIEFGALAPLESPAAEPVFSIGYVAALRTAEKLRRDYDLDLFVVVLLMDYLRRIEQLESQVRSLESEFSRSYARRV